ncbi:MAG: hypothetical protein ACFFBP_14250 [Promethearchaeota archaeon]
MKSSKNITLNESLKNVEKIVDINFYDYNLPDYDKFIHSLNTYSTDSENELYKFVPILIRALLENLLIDILTKCISEKHRKYYSDKRRAKDFF